jgi:Domain of unknown function (DUF1707)
VPDLRASDADRERSVEALRHHAAEGRLTVDELDEDERGTHMVASGTAPLRIRRAFAELED